MTGSDYFGSSLIPGIIVKGVIYERCGKMKNYSGKREKSLDNSTGFCYNNTNKAMTGNK